MNEAERQPGIKVESATLKAIVEKIVALKK
jgi:hypothetical protein